ncbi:MAG TPA: histidinol-phosphate aminotransferase family protein [Anaerolineae bacterium]|nr:histidinol-phosphate aminotransferase family protein [Anaerolineae bacterium]
MTDDCLLNTDPRPMPASPPPRPAILAASPVPHGAITPRELADLGLSPDQVIDFSANINPYGPPPAVRDALTRVPLDRYPDPDALALRRALAQHLERRMEHILVGNGASELIWLTALAFLDAGDRVVVVGPTYGEYARAARLMGADVAFWQAAHENDFAIHPDAIAARLDDVLPRVVFLCHPNNPTGQLLPLDALARWADAHPAALFVVDEAYLPFAAGAASALTLNAPNILILRSMTKTHALAGLRLGYAVGPEPIIAALRNAQPPWSVNALAQAAGAAALAHQTWVEETLARVQKDARALIQALRGAGWRPHPTAAHFFLLPVGNAASVRTQLLRRGVVVRDAASFGLPGHIRIAARTPSENASLLHALANLVPSP